MSTVEEQTCGTKLLSKLESELDVFLLYLFISINYTTNMTIHQNIKNQIVEALRAKDTIRLDTLRGLNALFMNEVLTQKSGTDSEFLADDKALALIKRSVKQRLDSIRQFEIGKRMDLADKERAELKILETYLPRSASKEEIQAVATKIANQMFKDGKMDAKSAGKLTGMIMKELGGNADGNDVKAVVEGMISAK